MNEGGILQVQTVQNGAGISTLRNSLPLLVSLLKSYVHVTHCC